MIRLMVRVVATTTLAVLTQAALVWAGPLQDDLAARRARLMEQLGADTLAIVWSAPPREYSLDVDYEYRQDSHLLYLTGITQPDSILVLIPGAKSAREVLFVRQPNPAREHREGHIPPGMKSRRRAASRRFTTSTSSNRS
jgi:hypothetical protein